MVLWQDFCACDTSANTTDCLGVFHVTLIEYGDLSPCMQMILQASAAILLFASSLGYLANFVGYRHDRISTTSTLHYVSLLRAWLCVFVSCSSLARSLIATNDFKGSNYVGSILYYVTMLVTVLAWLLLGAMFYTARYRFPLYKRGPIFVILLYIINVAVFAKSFQWYWMSPITGYRSTLVVLYTVSAFSHIFLFTALVPSGIDYTGPRYAGIQEEDGSSETERAILVTGTNRVSYRTFGSEAVVPRGEDGNCLSRLIFWWVQPLMKRGKLGLIQLAEDVFQVSAGYFCNKM